MCFEFRHLSEPSKTWNPMGLILNKALFASFQGYQFGPLMLFNKKRLCIEDGKLKNAQILTIF